MNIRTNNRPRDLVSFYELPAKEQLGFEYVLDWDRYSTRFFQYKGYWYDVQEFTRIVTRKDYTGGFCHCADDDSPLLKWEGIQTNSFFSGVLITYCEGYESVIVGRYWE